MADHFLDQYQPVEERLALFWQDHPEGRIVTEVLPAPEGQWVVKAFVFRDGLDLPDSTGHAQEVVGQGNVNRTSALENCETSAIGRALANLGYAPKGARPSREEMVKATEPTEVPPDVLWRRWVWDESAVFKAWTDDERKSAAAAGMLRLGVNEFQNQNEARAVLEEMRVAYEGRTDGLPLDV